MLKYFKIIPIIIMLIFFYFGNNCLAKCNHLVISELQISDNKNAKHDFIEIYNPTNEQIDLNKYELKKMTSSGKKYSLKSPLAPSNKYIKPYGFYLWASSKDKSYPMSIKADATTTQTISNNNGVAIIQISNKKVIDSVCWGDVDPNIVSYCETKPTNNNKKNIIERKAMPDANVTDMKIGGKYYNSGNGSDTNNNFNDFIAIDNSNPQNSKSPIEQLKSNTNTNTNTNINSNTNTTNTNSKSKNNYADKNNTQINRLGDIVINEFVSDPSDEDVEWIELYNTTNREIDLTNWYIEEGSKSKTELNHKIGKDNKNRFYVIENLKGNLNNQGDIINLYDNTSQLIDQVAYGNWNDGNIKNNAPVANNPYSVARKIDGYNTFNNSQDFLITSSVTKGYSNVITQANNNDKIGKNYKSKNKHYDYSNKIIISEIFPNPRGSDRKKEFIELYNQSKRDVDLTGWRLEDKIKIRYSLSNLYKFNKNNIIKKNQYLAIYRKESKIVLNNNGDLVKLYQPLSNKPYQSISYKKAPENLSLNNLQTNLDSAELIDLNNNWVWSKIITPGEKNIIKTINHPPIVDFSYPDKIFTDVPVLFDASDTIDQDDDNLKYKWDFGDGFTSNLLCPEHTFLKDKTYNIKLIVDDGKDKIVKEKIIKVINKNLKSKKKHLKYKVIINEIFPNPKGNDSKSEWIELYNKEKLAVDLTNWKLSNQSKSYKIKKNTIIKPNGYLLFKREKTKIALNNNSDTIKLFDSVGNLINKVNYNKAFEDKSYAFSNNGWHWTTLITPNKKNIIKTVFSNKKVDKKLKINKNKIIKTTIKQAKQFNLGDKLEVKGLVAVLPNVLSPRYFYIVSKDRYNAQSNNKKISILSKPNQCFGIKIYCYKKSFPQMRRGDYFKITGKLSKLYGEKIIKINNANDIKFIKHYNEPKAEKINYKEIKKSKNSRLIMATGKILKNKGQAIYLSDDSGNQIKIYIKKNTGINKKKFKKGDYVEVTGITSQTKNGKQILPRDQNDIKILSPVKKLKSNILGATDKNNILNVSNNKKSLAINYFLITIGGLFTILIGLFIKEKIKF